MNKNRYSQIEEGLARVRERIVAAARRAGRDPREVKLMAVTKGVSSEDIATATSLGVTDFGENRVQEAIAKFSGKPLGIRLHMIGHLQSNKAKVALSLFDTVQSVHSIELAALLSRLAALQGRIVPISLQVNTSGESTKYGFEPRHLFDAVGQIYGLPNLQLLGLMTIGPLVENPEDAREAFASLRRLRNDCRNRFGGDILPELSMGMSNDFEVAIEEGATMVRIGRAIFGEM